MHFDLPPCSGGWLRVIDTALPPDHDLPARPERWSPTGAPLESRSLMLMLAAPLLAGVHLDQEARPGASTAIPLGAAGVASIATT